MSSQRPRLLVFTMIVQNPQAAARRQSQQSQQQAAAGSSSSRIRHSYRIGPSCFRLLVPIHIGFVHSKVPVSIRREEEMIAIGTEPRVTIEGRRIEAKTR